MNWPATGPIIDQYCPTVLGPIAANVQLVVIPIWTSNGSIMAMPIVPAHNWQTVVGQSVEVYRAYIGPIQQCLLGFGTAFLQISVLRHCQEMMRRSVGATN